MVFSIGPFGQMNAVKFSDGSPVWEADLLKDWGAKRPDWGVAQSPLLSGNLVIVAPWGKEAALVAYDKRTANVVWKTPNDDGVAQDYQSPVPMQLCGRPMIVACGRKAYTIGVDPTTGERLWTYDDYSCRIHIPSPTYVGEDRILLTGGYGAGGAMFTLEPSADGYVARTLWANHNMGSKIAQPLVHEGYVYGNSSDTGGGLRCLALNSEIMWDSKDMAGFGMGSLLLADGLILIINGDNGDLTLCEVTPDGFRRLGAARVLGGNEIWGPLAYSDGKLVLRDQTQLVCIDLKE
jgi:outer membrane protein assembly factor BamB